MPRPIAARPLPGYRLWIRYYDGAEGEVDLSGLAGRGVFRAWEQPGVFESVTIGEHGAIVWSGDLDLCPDALYMELTGKKPEEVFPGFRSPHA